jgi:hypothetical protein
MEKTLNHNDLESEIIESFEGGVNVIDEARREWYSLNDYTRTMYDAFNDTDEGKDLQAIGVGIFARGYRALLLNRQGGPMADVEIWENEDGEFCYEYLSSKAGVERYNLSKFDTPEKCLRALLLRVIRNNIPAAIIPKKDIPNLNFNELVPVGANLTYPEIMTRMKATIGGQELSDLDVKSIENLPTMENLMELGLVGKGVRGDGTIISKVDKISPKYRFYSRATQRVGEIYGETIAKILDVKKNDLSGNIVGTSYEVWRVNNSNRMPINAVNFRTGDNSVKCNIQDNEIFGSVFIAIFKRTFKRVKSNKYEKEKLLIPSYSVRSKGAEKVAIAEELNILLGEYFTEAAETLEASVFIDPGEENTQIHDNALALLLKFLLKKGSSDLKSTIAENEDLKDLVDLTTRYEDMDELTKRLIQVSRALRYY